MVKNRDDLILENIELVDIVMRFKRGLHLAKRVIDVNEDSPNSQEAIECREVYNKYIKENDLTGI